MPLIIIEEALKGLGNNKMLYCRVLDKFAADYASIGKQIAVHVAAQEYEEAERCAHTIKGLAGTIGAFELADTAAMLERTCQEHIIQEDCAHIIEKFSTTLANTIAAFSDVKQTLLQEI